MDTTSNVKLALVVTWVCANVLNFVGNKLLQRVFVQTCCL